MLNMFTRAWPQYGNPALPPEPDSAIRRRHAAAAEGKNNDCSDTGIQIIGGC